MLDMTSSNTMMWPLEMLDTSWERRAENATFGVVVAGSEIPDTTMKGAMMIFILVYEDIEVVS